MVSQTLPRNPFAYSVDYSRSKLHRFFVNPIVLILSFVLIPLRVLLFLPSIPLLAVQFYFINMHTDQQKPLSPARTVLWRSCYFLFDIYLFFVFGVYVHEINAKKKCAKNAPVVVVNHTSNFDALVISKCCPGHPIAKEGVMTNWFMRQLFGTSRVLLVSRPPPKAIQEAILSQGDLLNPVKKDPDDSSINSDNPMPTSPANEEHSGNNGSMVSDPTNYSPTTQMSTLHSTTHNQPGPRRTARCKPFDHLNHRVFDDLMRNINKFNRKLQKKIKSYCKLVSIKRLYGSDSVFSAMNKRVHDTENKWLQTVVFPEGTVCAQNTLLRFKTGAFRLGVPVQPITVKYHWPINQEWLMDSTVVNIKRMLRCPFFYVTLEYHDPIELGDGQYADLCTDKAEHSEDHVETPQEFADRVGRFMAYKLNAEYVPYTNDDFMYFKGIKDASSTTEEWRRDYGWMGIYYDFCKKRGIKRKDGITQVLVRREYKKHLEETADHHEHESDELGNHAVIFTSGRKK